MFRFTLILPLLGVAVGLYFGIHGLLTGHEATKETSAKGGDSSSLYHAGRLDSTLGKVRDKVGKDSKVFEFDLFPGYYVIDTGSSRQDSQQLRVGMNGHIQKSPLSLTGAGSVKANAFPLSALKGELVQRLATATAAKGHATLDDVTHVIAMIDPISGKPVWDVYLQQGSYYQASLDGSGLGDPTARAKAAGSKALATAGSAKKVAAAASSQADSAAASAQSQAACMQAAGADASKLEACVGR